MVIDSKDVDIQIHKWNFNKKTRELENVVKTYEIHAQREIDNNIIAKQKGRKEKFYSQKFLQTCYKRYKEHTGQDYPNPKFIIE